MNERDEICILVVNAGSSTIKTALFWGEGKKPLWERHVEWKENFEKELKSVLQTLPSKKISAIGHRVVHGGETFVETTKISEDVKEQIKEHFFLAPLHNPINLEGIKICEEVFASTPQFAVFDTAFHATLDDTASTYPIPYAYREKGVRRYGFHGISYSYCSKRASLFLNQESRDLKMVICHLGAGASLCAIKGGKSIDTTMGMTPLEGLMMATRSGSIDPGVVLYLLKEENKSPDQIDDELNEKSGLLGISGFSSDLRLIIEKAEKHHDRAKLALDLFLHRLTSCIGSMIASLGGCDALVFTAGVGENSPLVRARACASFSFLGLEIDPEKNKSPSQEEREISSLTSRIQALVIPTHEEWQIAHECRTKLVQQS